MLSDVKLVILGIVCFSFLKISFFFFFQTHFKESNFFFFLRKKELCSSEMYSFVILWFKEYFNFYEFQKQNFCTREFIGESVLLTSECQILVLNHSHPITERI